VCFVLLWGFLTSGAYTLVTSYEFPWYREARLLGGLHVVDIVVIAHSHKSPCQKHF